MEQRDDAGAVLLTGGYVSNDAGSIGSNTAGSGSVTVTIGTWVNSGDLNIRGSGTVQIDGGYVSNVAGDVNLLGYLEFDGTVDLGSAAR